MDPAAPVQAFEVERLHLRALALAFMGVLLRRGSDVKRSFIELADDGVFGTVFLNFSLVGDVATILISPNSCVKERLTQLLLISFDFFKLFVMTFRA